jgi:hypothetical protein
MSNKRTLKEILFDDLKDMQLRMYRLSCMLEDWGRHFWIGMIFKEDGYSGRGFVVKPNKVLDYEQKGKRVCQSCFEDVYKSSFDPRDGYSISFNKVIKKLGIDEGGLEKLIMEMESESIEAYEIIRDLYLKRYLWLGGYNRLSVYFGRKVDYNKCNDIYDEIERNTSFGKSSILVNIKTGQPFSYGYRAASRQYRNPGIYKFSFMVYYI